MLAGGQKRANDDAGKRLPPSRALRPRRVIVGVLCLALFGAATLGLGFVWFVDRLPMREITLDRDADGIVVLTGRASRISDAIELLPTKRGKRCSSPAFIRRRRAAAIARLVPEHQQWVACCVDLDHSAVNTVGNAIQTRNWVKQE